MILSLSEEETKQWRESQSPAKVYQRTWPEWQRTSSTTSCFKWRYSAHLLFSDFKKLLICFCLIVVLWGFLFIINFNVDINRAEQTASQGDINPEPALDQSPFPGFLSLFVLFIYLFFISLNTVMASAVYSWSCFFFFVRVVCFVNFEFILRLLWWDEIRGLFSFGGRGFLQVFLIFLI